jgi:hypothetical protein
MLLLYIYICGVGEKRKKNEPFGNVTKTMGDLHM